MIGIKNLSFSYGKNSLFSGMDLTLGSGLYGLLGKNGAGKSTLLKILSGLLYPDTGSCKVSVFDPGKREAEFLSNLFYLPEEFYLPALTGRCYIDLYSPFYPSFDKTKLEFLISEFELDISKVLASLSYGQKKKFLLAFGLACGANIMLLDEPTNGLDIPSKSQFRRLVSSAVTKEKCIIISTHQVRDMEDLIDPVIIVDNGTIIFNHSMEEVSEGLRYSFSPLQLSGDEIIHTEKVPGGWAVISKNDGEGKSEQISDDNNIDIEVLFNAVIQKHGIIENILGRKDQTI
ncbi:MAG: ABC transporter ATP-binding protein [Spirochaetia bacterium]|jgi:ABC-2 type transport system ATP-binding protein|nr:ABC transporter ATP-binding protein [Spirochaetia bacterium]